MLHQAGATSTNARAYVVNPNDGQATKVSLTPLRSDGQVQYTQPQRDELLTANVSAVQAALNRLAAMGPFDLLSDISAAVRTTAKHGTLLVISSGLSTAGGFDLRKIGWDADPATVAAELYKRGLLPDLAGWRVVFSGLGDTTAPQPALPMPQRSTLIAYWIAICHAAHAVSCAADETTRPDPRSRSRIWVPLVEVPSVSSVTGPSGSTGLSVPDDEFFAFGNARLLAGADAVLSPVAARARTELLYVLVTGYASPDGGSASYNLVLSKLRAVAVRARLIALGVPASHIAVAWRGTAGLQVRVCYRAGRFDEEVCAELRRVVILTGSHPFDR